MAEKNETMNSEKKKNKKPWYKRVSIWIIIILCVAVIGSLGGSTDSLSNIPDANEPVELKIEYQVVDIRDMFKALEDNALLAEKTYQNTYVTISGSLDVIDSDGAYISIGCGDDLAYLLQNVQCYIENEEQLNFIMTKKRGDIVTVSGKITSIGELLGYTLNIDSIQ